MPSLLHRLKILSTVSSKEDVAAIGAEALRFADDAERLSIASRLSETGRDDALAAVMRSLPQLGSDGRRLLAQQPRDLSRALRQVLNDGHRVSLVSAVSFIGTTGDVHLLLPAMDLISGPDPKLREAMGEAVLQVTTHLLGPQGRWVIDTPTTQTLDRVLTHAAGCYRDHRSPAVLLAVALAQSRVDLATDGLPALRRVLDGEAESIGVALASLAEHGEHPLVRHNLLRWLTEPRLGRGLARRWSVVVETCLDQLPHMVEVFAQGHLLLAPARRKVARRLERLSGGLPDVRLVNKLPAAAATGAVRFGLGMPVGQNERIGWLSSLARTARTAGRVRSLMGLMSHATPDARAAIVDCVGDRRRPVAHFAAMHLMSDGGLTREEAAYLELSPHASLVELAQVALSRCDIEGFFQRWLDLPLTQRVAAARLLVQREPDQLAERLGELVQSEDAEEAVPAIMLCRRISEAASVLPAIVAEVKNTDSRIASAAVAALGDMLEGETTRPLMRRILAYGLQHSDPRVRANAVEAVSADEIEDIHEVLMPLTEIRENRTRANALSLLLGPASPVEGGLEHLRDMLGDDDPQHRLSAIWVARRRRVRSVAKELAQTAKGDAVPEVRLRAGQTLRLLGQPSLERHR